MTYPIVRPRRLRSSARLREMLAETHLRPGQFVQPLFVRYGTDAPRPIASMPGIMQHTLKSVVEEAKALENVGVPAIILFGIPEVKDSHASGAYADDGIVQQAIRAIKEAGIDVMIITDVCLCEYTDHGHCGVVVGEKIDNDATLPLLAREAVSHAEAGADMVAPSDMMDGRVGAIREALDGAGHSSMPIMSYAAKYASAFYGPFRDAAESPPSFGDRRSYQMDPANRAEALREVELDLQEGADIIMVKPAFAYLDIIRDVKETFGCPTAAYSVSGEYAMVKAGAERGWLDEQATVLEIMTGIHRAGAGIIVTYWAKQIAGWLSS